MAVKKRRKTQETDKSVDSKPIEAFETEDEIVTDAPVGGVGALAEGALRPEVVCSGAPANADPEKASARKHRLAKEPKGLHAGRAQAKDALFEIEERYRSLVDASLDAVLLTIPDGGVLSANDAACRMFGYSEDEFLGKGRCGIGDPADPRLALALEERTRTGRFHGELTFVRKDGTKFPGEISSAVFTTRLGEQRTSMVIRDITERKQAEEALRILLLRQEAILAAVPDIIMEVNKDKIYTWANPAGIEFFGEEVLGKEANCFYVGEQDTYAAVQPLLDGDEGVFYVESWQHRRDGEKRLLAWWCRAIKDEQGRVTGALSTARDITERQQAEQSLRASQQVLERTFACLNDAVFIVDPRTRIVTACNQAVERVFGYRAEEVIGRNTLLLHISPQTYTRFGRELLPALDAAGVFHTEFKMRRKDGAVIVTEHAVTELRDETGERVGLVSVVRDITERKRAEEALAAYQKQLQLLTSALAQSEDRERRRIAVYLHDQVGQLLAAVRVKFAAWKGMRPSSKRRLLLSDIERLIDQAIDDTRSLTFDLSPPILYELGLGPALEWLGENLCEKEGIAFEFRDDGRGRKIEEALASALYRIVRELLLNSMKHAQAGRVSVSVSADTHDMRLMVNDDGIGMEQSQYERALKGASGTYGLFSIRERLRHLNGAMEIESSPGEGTRVTVAAPLSNPVSSPGGGYA